MTYLCPLAILFLSAAVILALVLEVYYWKWRKIENETIEDCRKRLEEKIKNKEYEDRIRILK